MFKYLVVFIVIVSICSAEDDNSQGVARKKHKYHKHHLRHHLYYLAFFALKAKIVFLIGTMITVALFAGKFFAFLRYGTYWLGTQKKSEPEKVYVNSDHHPTFYPSSEFFEPNDHSEYSSYGRNLGDSLFENWSVFKNVVQSLDLSDLTFESMDISNQECRKKFVCEADFVAKNNTILALGMYILSDPGLDKYRSNFTTNDITDCSNLYPLCLGTNTN